jgi:Ser/Thr protein kinase RdoA (MazF antagonist)
MQPVPDERALEAVARSLSRDADMPGAHPQQLSVIRMGATDAWLLGVGQRALVLKRYRRGQDEADVRWEHAFLERLAATAFPAPRPVQALTGRSWLRLDDRVWGTLTYLPGRSLSWECRPGLDMAGMFLADYHGAARSVLANHQRPSGVPLPALADLAPWDRLPAALREADRLRHFARLLDELGQELSSLEYGSLDQIVIHGDCTTDNMLVDGTPPRMVGLIDFGNAYFEGWPADLGAGLWRSGRAGPDAIGLDARRVARFVAGYHRRSPLESRLVRAIPTLIRARGLQLIVRWTRRAAPGELPTLVSLLTQTLDRATWIRDHQLELEDAIVAAISA